MSPSFDPDFQHFRNAQPYRNISTDHEAEFRAFRSFLGDGKKDANQPVIVNQSPHVMQFVCHPNFKAHQKEIGYYEWTPAENGYVERASLPSGYLRANCFKNYRSSTGHPKGLFYEVNLYRQTGFSAHHTSRQKGTSYDRDDSHDGKGGQTKGPHWLETSK